MTSRSFPFTINNPEYEWDGGDVPVDPGRLFEKAGAQARYIVYSYEIGESGTPHYQGWIQLKTKERMSAIHKWGGEWAHASLQIQRGSDQQNEEYCSKTDDPTHVAGPWEFGVRVKQGERTDIQQACQIIKEGGSCKRVAEEFPETFVKFGKGIERLEDILYQPPGSHHDLVLSQWMGELVDILDGPSDGRTVRWYCDRDGGAGKTEFTAWMERRGAISFELQKHDRMRHQYNGEKVVIFDFCRDTTADPDTNKIPYNVIESFANGVSQKMYGLKTRRFERPHVVVFANEMPDQTKMSWDRWKITEL